MITLRYYVRHARLYRNDQAQAALAMAALKRAAGFTVQLSGLPAGAHPVYERPTTRRSYAVSPHLYAGYDKASGLHAFEDATRPGVRELYARRKRPPASWHLKRGAYCFEFVRSDAGAAVRHDACAFCGLDIEGPYPEWRDRGNNTTCPHGSNKGEQHAPRAEL